VLARITDPTEGSAEIRGRVSSLLEVGTGFHPELSGRDNVFLNGAVLGMSRAETAAKFDEIVEFSGVREFIDMPVKRYSSGMYVRLAFSVAAHLDPEILLLDECSPLAIVRFRRSAWPVFTRWSKRGEPSSSSATTLPRSDGCARAASSSTTAVSSSTVQSRTPSLRTCTAPPRRRKRRARA